MTKLLTICCFFIVFSVFAQESEGTDVGFAIIENVPVYPGCKGQDNADLKKCMSEKISTFVGLHFNQRVVEALNLPAGKHRIFARFKIDKQGIVCDVQARASQPELENEVIRVIALLPQMMPGKQKGEPVGVLYSLPVVFNVEATKETKKEKKERLKREKQNTQN